MEKNGNFSNLRTNFYRSLTNNPTLNNGSLNKFPRVWNTTGMSAAHHSYLTLCYKLCQSKRTSFRHETYTQFEEGK